MPVAPTYPGVYIQEIPSGVRTIVGVATSIAAFVDFFRRGPMNTAVEILSISDFQRTFGGLDARSEASYAIQQFFLNGGTDAYVVRVASGTPTKATVTSLDAIGGGAANALNFTAISEGAWGNNLRVAVEPVTGNRFNLIVSEVDTVNGQLVVVNQEVFRGLSMSPMLPSPPAPPNTPDPNFVDTVVGTDPNKPGSNLIRISHASPANRPLATGTVSDTTFTFPTNPPAPNQPLRVRVTFTPVSGSPTQADVNLGMTPISGVDEAASRLEAAIRNANPGLPEWGQATARVANGLLQVSAGPTAPNTIISFAAAPASVSPPFAADTTTVTRLALTGGAVTQNVSQYLLGYTGGSAVGAQAAGAAGNAGNDGTPPDATALIGNSAAIPPTGLYALDKVDLFNILCLPRLARADGLNPFGAGLDTVLSAATAYCEQRRAFLIVDTPSNVTTIPQVKAWLAGRTRHRNLALYFPRVQYPDPLNNFRLTSFGASGALAGVYARTDVERGVWKAPAGTEAVLRGVRSFDYKMTDAENGTINPLAINALRTFDVYGNVAWGARTLDGSDQQASDWKYVPVRRLALMIEESLYRGTKWAVFEPNDEPLWAQLRLNVGAFMHNLFRQGAFKGSTPREAYLVKCDKETTTQNDIDLGIVNILVGFAPLKPAEFVIITIQQLAGRIQT